MALRRATAEERAAARAYLRWYVSSRREYLALRARRLWIDVRMILLRVAVALLGFSAWCARMLITGGRRP